MCHFCPFPCKDGIYSMCEHTSKLSVGKRRVHLCIDVGGVNDTKRLFSSTMEATRPLTVLLNSMYCFGHLDHNLFAPASFDSQWRILCKVQMQN